MVTNQPTGFKDLLNAMMKRRWYITALVLGGFMFIIGGMFFAIFAKSSIVIARAIFALVLNRVGNFHSIREAK